MVILFILIPLRGVRVSSVLLHSIEEYICGSEKEKEKENRVNEVKTTAV